MLNKFSGIQSKLVSKVIKSANFYFYPSGIQIDIAFTSSGYAKLFQKGLPHMFEGKFHGTSRITQNVLTIKIK